MNILITCCLGDHIKSNVEDIRRAYPDCKIVGVDMRDMFFNHNGLDSFYKVPRCGERGYTKRILEICQDEEIDIVISFSSLDIAPFRKHRIEFHKIGVVVALGDNKGTEDANDKSKFCAFCDEIPPTSSLLKNSFELQMWMKENNIDEAVTKIVDSTGAKGMMRYRLKDIEYKLFAFDQPVIAQKYLSGTEYSVDCFCSNGRIMWGCVKKNYEMDLGVSIYSEIIDAPELIKLCEPACKMFCLDGLVGFDLKEDENGKAYILECNPRPTATISLVAKAGVNLLGHLIEYYMTGSTCFDTRLDYGMKVARFREDYYFKGGEDLWMK